jgi:hypothetical protein
MAGKRKRLPDSYKVAAKYVDFREKRAQCEQISNKKCDHCKARAYCQIVRSYNEYNRALAQVNR